MTGKTKYVQSIDRKQVFRCLSSPNTLANIVYHKFILKKKTKQEDATFLLQHFTFLKLELKHF